MRLPLAITIWFCLPLCLPAQTPLQFTPVFRNYTTDDGLPSNETFAITQDRQGYMWFSTTNGVCRFDGYRFEQFPDTQQTNFTAVFGWNMMEDSCGRMWWANSDGRVFYHENGRIIPWPHNHVVDSLRSKFSFVNGLIVGGCGEEIWLTSNYFGAVHVDRQGKWEILPQVERKADVFQIFERAGRTLCFIATPLFFQPHTPGRVPQYFIIQEGVYSRQLPVFRDATVHMEHVVKLRSGYYLMVWRNSIYLLKGLDVLWWRHRYDQEIVWLFEDDDGSLLVGQQRGGGVRRFASPDDLRRGTIDASFLEGLSISVIFKDREGGYWFGSQERGLFYCPSLKSAVVEGVPGMTSDVGTGVASGGAGKLFYGTKNGRIFELDLFRNTGRDITPGTIRHLNSLHFDETGRTLFCVGYYFSLFKEGKWLNNTYLNLVGMHTPLAGSRLARANRKNQWWDANTSCIRLMDWNTRKELENSVYTLRRRIRMHAIGVDTAGRVWVSTNEGLREYRDSQLLAPRERHPTFHQPADDILFLPDNTMVFCPRGYGVVFWKPGSGAAPQAIGEREGLVFNKVNRLFLEPDGAVWACTERGASRISADRSRIDNFTVRNGLPSNRVGQVALADGSYWLATAGGLVRLAAKLQHVPVPAPLLESVDVQGARYAAGKAISLPHDSSSLRIEWVSLFFRGLGQLDYRYRLVVDGVAGKWVSSAERRVNFSSLRPGSYRFDVQAWDEDRAAWSGTTAQEFSIRPPWWATWWARGAAALALALLAFAAYRYRIRQLRTESRMKEEMFKLERAALQAQMNPHFIFNCLNSIQNFILNNEPDAAVLYLAKFAKLVRGTLNASVAGSVSLEDEIGMLDNYLALEQLRFKKVFDYQIGVDENLDPVETRLPPLIVQPFVENAVLHGMKSLEKDGRIGVTFRQEDGFLQIDVLDNGAGVRGEQGMTSGGKISLGRSITHRRLELLQQQHERQVISVQYLVPEQGTHVLIRLPL